MDPFSAITSAASLIGLICQSCRSLCSFFQDLSGVPDEVRHRVLYLEALSLALTNLLAIGPEGSEPLLADNAFLFSMKACHKELATMELKLRKVNVRLAKQGISSTWARVSWILSSRKQVDGFFQRVQHHSASLTMYLLPLQL